MESYNHKKYKIIREIGWDNFVCEVILVMSDDTTDTELRQMEQKYIDKFESKKSMNTNDANTGIDRIEYKRLHSEKLYEKNKEKRIAQSKEWINNNRDKYNELQRKSYLKKSLWKKSIAELCNITIYED